MPHAIIVVGNERRYVDKSAELARYLHAETGSSVDVIRGAYLHPEDLETRLRRGIRRAKDRPLLVAYFGHGHEDHWGYALEHQRKHLHFGFERLASLLSAHAGPIAIINDTCHADGLRPFLERAGLAERCMLIAACAAEDVSYGGLGREVVARWRDGVAFETIREREDLCIIEQWGGYVPPFKTRLRDAMSDLMLRFRNLFRARARRVPPPIRIHFPPNGWGVRQETTERAIGLRWGAALDHLFFPKPS